MSFVHKSEAGKDFDGYNYFYSHYREIIKSFTTFRTMFDLDLNKHIIVIKNNRKCTIYVPFKIRHLKISL